MVYITNPGPGETVDPTGGNPANYADTEYSQEFPNWGLSGATVLPVIASDSPGVSLPSGGTLPGPSYKWVRINPVTEQSLQLDVNGDGVLDGASVLFYDPAHVNTSNQPAPSLVVPTVPSTPPTPTSVQALEITAFAVAPNGGHRLLQYVVAPLIISPDAMDQNFPAALTLDGNGVNYAGPGTNGFMVNGQDQRSGSPLLFYSIGYTNAADGTNLVTAATPAQNYQGAPPGPGGPPPVPSHAPGTIANVSPTPATSLLRQSWMTPATLDAVMQDIENSADVVLTGSVNSTEISNAAPLMSPTNPMTVVVNGNLRLNGRGFTGYGLLLVTGTLTYDPDASWNGIVLVVGQGILASNGSGSGGFEGTVFVAQTRDSSGNLLPALGGACFGSDSSCGVLGFGHGHHGFGSGYGSTPGFGIAYNSFWINGPLSSTGNPPVAGAQGPLTYKVLSFHEIPLPN